MIGVGDIGRAGRRRTTEHRGEEGGNSHPVWVFKISPQLLLPWCVLKEGCEHGTVPALDPHDTLKFSLPLFFIKK